MEISKATEREQLDNIIDKWIKEKRVGSITINFFKGGISSVKLEKTIKLSKQE